MCEDTDSNVLSEPFSGKRQHTGKYLNFHSKYQSSNKDVYAYSFLMYYMSFVGWTKWDQPNKAYQYHL